MGRRGLGAMVGIGGTLAYVAWCRPRLLRSGTTAAERHRYYPGDHLVPQADLVATRAITVDGPPSSVWPWLVQMGQGRGGFYSYDALENVFGLGIHSVERLVGEWQHLAVGDVVRLHPGGGLQVAMIEANHALVLVAGPGTYGSQRPPPPFDFSWAFVIERHPEGATRLLVRERYGYQRPWAAVMAEPVAVVSWLMTRRMLAGIKARAEGATKGLLA